MNRSHLSLCSLLALAFIVAGCGHDVAKTPTFTLDASRLESGEPIHSMLRDEQQAVKKEVELDLAELSAVRNATLELSDTLKKHKQGQATAEQLKAATEKLKAALPPVLQRASAQVNKKLGKENLDVVIGIGLDGFVLVYAEQKDGEPNPLAAVAVRYIVKDDKLADYESVLKLKN